MAKSPGDLFRGSDLAGIAEFDQYRADAVELLAATDPALSLPPKAVVFLSHQGYTFLFLLAVGQFDGPVMQWIEMEREPRQVAPTFAEMVDAELCVMESNLSSLPRPKIKQHQSQGHGLHGLWHRVAIVEKIGGRGR